MRRRVGSLQRRPPHPFPNWVCSHSAVVPDAASPQIQSVKKVMGMPQKDGSLTYELLLIFQAGARVDPYSVTPFQGPRCTAAISWRCAPPLLNATQPHPPSSTKPSPHYDTAAAGPSSVHRGLALAGPTAAAIRLNH
jgi:hypothetical protein